MDVSIVIVNFNTPEVTIDCLRSIVKLTIDLEYEIILVDNAPKKDCFNRFKNELSTIKYIKNISNVGFGVANNIGIEICEGKYILLLNSDTILIENSLKNCFDYMEKKPNVGLLGCKLLNKDLSFQGSFFPFTNNSIWTYLKGNNYFLFKILNIKKKYREPSEILKVGDISGAFMFFRGTTIEKTKAFDPDFFLYCEESEWCRDRVSKISNIVYYPFTKVIHIGGQSAPKDYMFIQSRLSLFLMYYKHGWFNYLLFILVSYFNILVNSLFYFVVNNDVRKEIIQNIKVMLELFPYIFIKIPKYPKQWGSRKEPLVYNKAKFIFFPENR